MLHGVGFGFLIVGLILLGISLISKIGATVSFRRRPVHDGIGGEDTKNLTNGCLGVILSIFCLYGGAALTAIGAAIMYMTR
jgi:hypothetical protein